MAWSASKCDGKRNVPLVLTSALNVDQVLWAWATAAEAAVARSASAMVFMPDRYSSPGAIRFLCYFNSLHGARPM